MIARMKDAYTVAEVAAAVGVSEVTIRAYKHRGQMPAPSGVIGRTPYWRARKIEPWIEERGGTVKDR